MDDGWNLGNGRLGDRATAYSKRSKLPPQSNRPDAVLETVGASSSEAKAHCPLPIA